MAKTAKILDRIGWSAVKLIQYSKMLSLLLMVVFGGLWVVLGIGSALTENTILAGATSFVGYGFLAGFFLFCSAFIFMILPITWVIGDIQQDPAMILFIIVPVVGLIVIAIVAKLLK